MTSNENQNKNQLHLEFVRLGKERHKITYKLLALLPKINENGVYREKGFVSIFEYSFKLAGLSEALVKKALKLDEHLIGKPHLQKAIETQGIHKVALVAKIATPQTDLFFADKVENMSKSALVVWGKEIRREIQNWPEEKNDEKPKMKIELDDEMEFLFLKLKNKFGKKLSNKETLKRIFQTLDQALSQKNIKLASSSKISREKFDNKDKNIAEQTFTNKSANTYDAANQPDARAVNTQIGAQTPKRTTRYIPVAIKRIIIEKTNGKCAHEGCNKPYEILHHVERFAASGSHDSIIPLCKEHHEFAHNGLRKNDRVTDEDMKIDKLFRSYRRVTL